MENDKRHHPKYREATEEGRVPTEGDLLELPNHFRYRIVFTGMRKGAAWFIALRNAGDESNEIEGPMRALVWHATQGVWHYPSAFDK